MPQCWSVRKYIGNGSIGTSRYVPPLFAPAPHRAAVRQERGIDRPYRDAGKDRTCRTDSILTGCAERRTCRVPASSENAERGGDGLPFASSETRCGKACPPCGGVSRQCGAKSSAQRYLCRNKPVLPISWKMLKCWQSFCLHRSRLLAAHRHGQLYPPLAAGRSAISRPLPVMATIPPPQNAWKRKAPRMCA